jgi:2'-5' RNA ligase
VSAEPAPASTAVLLPVPEAEPVVGAWRDRYDLASATGVPAHVTILFPFIPPDTITSEDEAALGEVVAGIEPFAFRLARTGRFGDAVLYLAPEPVEPIVAMTEAVFARFPAHPPYGWAQTDIVPHLTVAHCGDPSTRDDPAVLDRIEGAIAPSLPIEARATHVLLMEGDGRWRVRARLPLGGLSCPEGIDRRAPARSTGGQEADPDG